MQFLTHGEIYKLHQILIHRTLLRTADADTRSNLLGNCGLTDICSVISLNTPVAQFVVNIWPKLTTVYVITGETKQLGLVVFLEYLGVIDPNLSEDDKVFFRHVVTKWGEAHASPPQGAARRSQLQNLLDQARQEQPPPPSDPKRLKIDRDIIVNYNLDEQMARFRRTVGYEGTFTFAVGGNFDILERYIIERIRRELKAKTERPHQRFEIRLYRDRIAAPADIERKLLVTYHFDNLTDLFDEQADTDIVLIIWNYDLPAAKMKVIAGNFCQAIELKVLPYLHQQGRCLVIIWADVDRPPLAGFTGLPMPDKFELVELLPWFRGKLKQLNLEERLIEHCLDRLRNQEGHLIGTYQEMNQIIRELQGGMLPL